MKTAEQWVEIQSDSPVRPGSLEHRFMCDAVRAIQLDAWKQGMTDAADLAEKGRSYAAAKYIREKRDATQSL